MEARNGRLRRRLGVLGRSLLSAAVAGAMTFSCASVSAFAESLEAAPAVMTAAGESALDPANLAAGEYSVNVEMINASSPGQKSMSDKAVTKPIKITVDDSGNYTASMSMHGISIKLGGVAFFGYMKSMWYNAKAADATEDDYQPVTVDASYDLIDGFNDENSDGKADFNYPHRISFPLVNKNAGDKDGMVDLKVFVPIMDSISAGTGTQKVLMKIDWDTIVQGADAANNALEAEEPRMELDKAITDAKAYKKAAYTAASFKVLTDAIAAAGQVSGNIYATAAELQAAQAKLAAAVKGLAKPQAAVAKTALPKGSSFTVSGITYKVINASAKTVAATGISTSAKKLTLDTVRYPGAAKYNVGTYKVAEVGKSAVKKAAKLTAMVLGANVNSIGSKAFAKAKKLKTVTVKSTKLTKKGVKGCLKGSKVTAVKVPKAKKKAYAKIFTKKNVGKKVTVK